ncbi:MAG: TetR/AcrR family transcriptional regulator [Pseudomonadota bacterium]
MTLRNLQRRVPKGRSMRKPHDEIRAAALDHAETIVVEDGLAALSARRVAAEAGCSVGTLYNIFGQLDGLVDAVNLKTLRMLGEEVGATLASLPEGAEREARLAALAAMYLRFARTHRNRWSALFEHRGAGPPDTKQQTVENMIFARIAAAVGFDPNAIDKRAADSLRMLFAAVHGVVAFAVNRTIPPRDAERYVAIIVKVAVRGYRELIEEGAP